MTQRTLNFTDRSTIVREEIDADLSSTDEGSEISIKLNLAKHETSTPVNAVFTMRTKGVLFRYVLGPVETGQKSKKWRLPVVARPNRSYTCNVQLIAQGELQLILAASADFSLFIDDQSSTSSSLIKVARDSTLQVPWILDFDDGEVRLLICDKPNVYDLLTQSKVFKTTVIAPVMYQVALAACLQPHLRDGALAKWGPTFSKFGMPEEWRAGQMTFADADIVARDFSQSVQVRNKVLGELIEEADRVQS